MSALEKWNGGVIIISHDEKFITTVANQVKFHKRLKFADFSHVFTLTSYGFAEMAQLKISRETCRATR